MILYSSSDTTCVWKYSESVWQHTRNVTYTYNEFNNPVEEFDHGRMAPDRTVRHFVFMMQITTWKKSGSMITLILNGSTGRKSYTIMTGITTQFKKSEWDGMTINLCNEMKSTYNYDGNNKKIFEMMYYWDEGYWEESQKFDFQYDDNNNLYQLLSEVLIENQWVKHQKSVYIFDTINNLLNVLSSNWDTATSEWAHPHMQQNYTNDEDNNRIIFIMQTWYEDDEVWTNLFKSTYYYLPTGSEYIENKSSGINKSIEDFQTTEDDIIIDLVKDDKVLTRCESIDRYLCFTLPMATLNLPYPIMASMKPLFTRPEAMVITSSAPNFLIVGLITSPMA